MTRSPTVVLAVLVCLLSSVARAQSAAPDEAPPVMTLFPHPDSTWWWLSGQMNIIEQAHPAFSSPYSGPNSFRADKEYAISRVMTLFAGARLGRGWEVAFDVESAGGSGLSDALGLAGFTNLDVVRNPELGSTPYVARATVRKIIAFSNDDTPATPSPLSFAPRVPARRLEIRAGKFSTVDFFDINGVGSDSHLQFTNWTVDNNGAYDYAADTRGYTYGVVVEYHTPRWSLRGAEALMPTVANGITFDTNVTRARGENVEFELRPASNLTLRVLGYDNHANMGSYTEAIDAFHAGSEILPDVTAHREQGRIKGGVGANVEYATGAGIRLFGRVGWNGGDTESFAYTEVNHTVSGGGDSTGARWRRPTDRLGVAFVSNGLSGPHKEYLRLGGAGFLLGDGTLSYGRESIVESYYTAHIWRGILASGGVQFVEAPGYNRDRGPVFVQMARLHLDF